MLIGILGVIIPISMIIIYQFYHKEIIIYQPQTIVEDQKAYLISVTYPKTNLSKVDRKIMDYIDLQTKNFKSTVTDFPYLIDRSELNIDFEYSAFNQRYINIILKTDYYDGEEKQNYYDLYSILYDLKQKQFLNILDFFSDQEKLFQKIQDSFQKENNITISNIDSLSMLISNNQLIVYYQSDQIYSISIPLTKLDLNLEITTEKKEVDITELQRVVSTIDPEKPVVAITFDDGPSQYTKEIIKTLKENDCNATFFVLGNKVEAYQDVIRESIKNGNEIGNHSYNHKWLSRLSKEKIMEQINKTQDILQQTVNYTPTHLRPTYGSVNQRIKNTTKLSITLWTIDTKDWKLKNVDRIVERAIKNIEDGDIILMHDIFERSSEALKKLIPLLKEQGYQLVTISELEEVKLLRTKY